MSDPTSVLFVCLGNICRSPLADALLRHKLRERGLAPQFRVDSAGTADYHVGKPPDPRTQEVLRAHHVPVVGRARQVTAADWSTFDHLLAMDHANLHELTRRRPEHASATLALVLEPTGGGEVPDPYYGGDDGFEHVYRLLDGALDGWIERWT